MDSSDCDLLLESDFVSGNVLFDLSCEQICQSGKYPLPILFHFRQPPKLEPDLLLEAGHHKAPASVLELVSVVVALELLKLLSEILF